MGGTPEPGMPPPWQDTSGWQAWSDTRRPFQQVGQVYQDWGTPAPTCETNQCETNQKGPTSKRSITKSQAQAKEGSGAATKKWQRFFEPEDDEKIEEESDQKPKLARPLLGTNTYQGKEYQDGGVVLKIRYQKNFIPHGDDDDDDGKGKEKGRGKPSSETEAVLKAKGVPIPPFPATFPPSSEAAPKEELKEEPEEKPKEGPKEEVKEESREMTPHEKRIAEMKKKIAEFRQGYGTTSSKASPMPKEVAYSALPGTAPRPSEDPPAAAAGRPPPKAMPAEIAGQVRPSRAPGGGDDGDGGGDDEREYTLSTIDEEEGEEEEEDRRVSDPRVLIEGAAISWQLKVFVSLGNEAMEDLLYRVRRLALDEMGAALPGEQWPISHVLAQLLVLLRLSSAGFCPLRMAWTSPLSSTRRSERSSTIGVPMSHRLSEVIHGRMVVWLLVG
eukprot:s849_g23.t1